MVRLGLLWGEGLVKVRVGLRRVRVGNRLGLG